MENNNDFRMSRIIHLENEMDRINHELNVLRKDIFYSGINKNLCKGHVHYSYTELGEMYCQGYISKNFKMKGKYVPSFLGLINNGNKLFWDEYFVLPPEHYCTNIHDEDTYLVSMDYYGQCVNINIFNLSKDRLKRNKERRGIYGYE